MASELVSTPPSCNRVAASGHHLGPGSHSRIDSSKLLFAFYVLVLPIFQALFLRALWILIHWMQITTLWEKNPTLWARDYYYLYFCNEETEAQSWSNLPKVTQLISGDARRGGSWRGNPESMLLTTTTCSLVTYIVLYVKTLWELVLSSQNIHNIHNFSYWKVEIIISSLQGLED